MATSGCSKVMVLGRDSVGAVATSDGTMYYLTDCCGASAKGCDGYVGCRKCYQEVDPALGDVPNEEMHYHDGTWVFAPKPLHFVVTYGDGISLAQWKRHYLGR